MKKKLKAGNVTLALTLISIGVLALSHNLVTSEAQRLFIRQLVDFWPLLLLVLGVEMLVKQVWANKKKDVTVTRLDGPSILLLVIIIIVVNIVGSGQVNFFPGFFFNFHNQNISYQRLASADAQVSRRQSVDETTQKVFMEVAHATQINVLVSEDGAEEMSVQARVTGSAIRTERAQELADGVTLRIDPGSITRVIFDKPRMQPHEHVRLVIDLLVPYHLALEIENSFGSVSVSNRGDDVMIRNRQGTVTIDNIEGNVRVNNSYKAVNVTNVTGNVDIESVHGALYVKDVGGITTLATSFAAMDIQHIGGYLQATNRHGRISVGDVQGDIDVSSSFNEIQVNDVGGNVKVINEHGRVVIDNVTGEIDARTTFNEVRISNFVENVHVRNRNGAIYMETGVTVTFNIDALTTYANIDIHLPATSDVNVDAKSVRGRIYAPPVLEVNASDTTQTIMGQLGTGMGWIRLRTENGNITFATR